MKSKQKSVYLSHEQVKDIRFNYGDPISIKFNGRETIWHFGGYKKGRRHPFVFYNYVTFQNRKDYRTNKHKQLYEKNKNDSFILYLQKYKLSVGCQNSDCPCDRNKIKHYHLDFDHLNPEEKKSRKESISYMTTKYMGCATKESKKKWKQKILHAISTCQILCGLCHRDKTRKEKCGREKQISRNTRDISEYADRPPVLTLNYEQ